MEKQGTTPWGQNKEEKTQVTGAGSTESGDYLAPFSEARLFHNEDRATLTFYLGHQVASIHFDRNRQEIFYKGHNVKNMALSQEQWLMLREFSAFLVKNRADSQLIQAYEECLAQVLPKR